MNKYIYNISNRTLILLVSLLLFSQNSKSQTYSDRFSWLCQIY